MLNIGKLSPGAAQYYVGEIASSAEDYYTGRGEAAGRWVGSLAGELGLIGEVGETEFRRILDGRHPHTGEYLVTAQGSAARAARRRAAQTPEPRQAVLHSDCVRAATRLRVSPQYVRRLLLEGERFREARDAAADAAEVVPPRAYLLGERTMSDGGAEHWQIDHGEIDRFLRERQHVKARPGYDLTLRPPKSVSILWALSGPDRRTEIRRAHSEAVDQVVRYYERHGVRARMHKRGRVETCGIVAAAFDHRTSRAGDPLLHTHVVTANMTCTEAGAWRAVDGIGLFEHAKAGGHLYQAHLRHLLATRLGVAFEPVVNGYAEVAGVPRRVIEVFSKRRDEIEEVLSESGATSAHAAQVATVATRTAKDYSVDADTLQQRWEREAADAAFGPHALERCFGRPQPEPMRPADAARLTGALAGPEGLTRCSPTFTRADVIESISCAVGAACSAAQIELLADRFLASPLATPVEPTLTRQPEEDGATVVPLGTARRRLSTQQLYSTPELIELEATILEWAEHGFGTEPPIADEATVEAVLTARPDLSAEQAEMVRRVCSAPCGTQPVAGRPGSGKTFALEAVVAAYTESAVPVVGCAVSATAAAQLELAARFRRSGGAPAQTVARVLLDLDDPQHGGLPSGTVVIVDEASMLGTRDLARLSAHAAAAGGAIKLVGDPLQHGAVDVGGVFARLCREAGTDLVQLVENNRQTDPNERRAVADYREARIAEALARYDDASNIVHSSTARASYDAMVADWYAARQSGHADPMIAGPNSIRRALNDRARALLKDCGELDGPAIDLAGREFCVGDEVIARRNDRGLRSADNDDFIKNGSIGTVTAVDPEHSQLIVDFQHEGTMRLPRRYLAAGHLEHAYALTTYAVQGATLGAARYHPTDNSSFEEGYVALTRGRDKTRLYVVDGTVTHDDEANHVPPEPETRGLVDIIESMSLRRANTMVHDIATDAHAVAHAAAEMTLAELNAKRRRLDRILDAAPPYPKPDSSEAERLDDSDHARRQLRPREANDQLVSLAPRRLTAALQREAERSTWLHAHDGDIRLQSVLNNATRARIERVRLGARREPDPTISQRERLAWGRAVDRSALERDSRTATD